MSTHANNEVIKIEGEIGDRNRGIAHWELASGSPTTAPRGACLRFSRIWMTPYFLHAGLELTIFLSKVRPIAQILGDVYKDCQCLHSRNWDRVPITKTSLAVLLVKSV